MSKQFDIAIPHATLLAIFAATLALNLPVWLTSALLLWLSLSFTALLYMADTPRRDFVQGTLRHPKFTQIYRVPAKWAVDWFWGRYCDDSYEGNKFFKTFQHALTWKLYDKALLIAVVYPVLLLILFWIATGQDGRMGNVIVLPTVGFWPERAATLGAAALIILGVIAKNLAAARRHRVMRRAANGLLFLVLIIATAVATVATTAVAIVVAITVMGTIAFALVNPPISIPVFAFAAATAVALPFPIAFAFAFAPTLAFAIGAASNFLAVLLGLVEIHRELMMVADR